jgi:hypothetical protein
MILIGLIMNIGNSISRYKSNNKKGAEGGEHIKHYLIEYRTLDGEHEYTEYAVTTARTYNNAERRAKKGKASFNRYGWEEFCSLDGIQEIPVADYEVLKKYFTEI